MDENGKALADPTTVPASSLGDGSTKADGTTAGVDNVVDLSTWANDNNGTSRVSGYTFKEARIGTRTGTVITGLKGEKVTSSGTYSLKYTTESPVSSATADADWTQYKDSTSGTNVNNANVFLIYTTAMTAPITVHYMNTEGNPLKDSAGNEITKVIDTATLSETNTTNHFTDMQDANKGLGTEKINGYQFKTDVNSSSNSYIYAGNTGSDTELTFNYAGSGSAPSGSQFPSYQKNVKGTINGATFRFIRYDSANKRILVARSNGNQPYSVAGGDWGIYITYPIADSLSVTIHRVDANGNKIADDVTKSVQTNSTVSNSDATAVNGYSSPTMHYGSYNGTSFTTMTYSKDTVKWTSTADSTATENLASEVWAVYQADNTVPVTIHHVDSTTGKLIAPDTTQTVSSPGTKIELSSTNNSLDGYNYSGAYVGWTSSISKGTSVSSVTYTLDGNDWKSTLNTEHAATDDLKKEIWIEYTRTNPNQIIIHHVDEDGKPVGANIVTNISVEQSDYTNVYDGYTLNKATDTQYRWSDAEANGYTYVRECIGDINTPVGGVPDGNKVMYHYDNGWQTGYGTGSFKNNRGTYTFNKTHDSLVTDIYHVYRNNNAKNRFTVHYVDQNGNAISGVSNETFTLTGDEANPTKLTEANHYVKTIENYTYSTTRVGSVDGPQTTSVRLSNGEIQYLQNSTFELPRQGNNARWSRTAMQGHTYTVYKDGDNYRLNDSEYGSIELNYAGEGTKGSKYTATRRTEKLTIEYSIEPTNKSTGSDNLPSSYTITVTGWLPNNSTDIYQIYTTSSESGKIWINDDLKYSGYFVLAMDDTVSNHIENKDWTNVYYSWHRVTRPASETSDATVITNYTTDEQVTRQQKNSQHWNLDYSASDRTWLDVEADNGERTKDNQAGYYVELHYTEDGQEKSIKSAVQPVNYYGDLENGGFETPQYTSKPSNQIKNSDYATSNGVWQSTGTGQESGGDPDVSIEIVNTKATSTNNQNQQQTFKDLYKWYTGTGDTRYEADGKTQQYAVDGDQFAELNCSVAGALYQDVITHPNEELNYWFSHRARGTTADQTPEIDTMYLVIMPTKIAMTSASDGGELKDQSNLIDFIQAHGGFTFDRATSEEDEITYRDVDNGILIRKVSSDDQNWHSINATNGYIAKGGLTRFFFVAGPTSWKEKSTYTESGSKKAVEGATHGNFLDAVGFSQEPPTPKGFDLTVKKTFSGLSSAELAGLAENSGNAAFQITISDKHVNTNTSPNKEEDSDPNSSLNGAKLKFTYKETGGVYTFTPTATLDGNNLFTDENDSDGTARTNDDGSVTMTWSFRDEEITNGQIYNYTIDESNTNVSGKSMEATQTVSPQSSINAKAAEVETGKIANFDLTNTYKAHTDSDQPQIVVTKTFSGVTPSTVDTLLASGYQITVTKTGDENGTAITNGVSTTLNANKQELDTNVDYTELPSTDGTTTLRWVITGTDWGSGTYSIEEKKYTTTANTIKKVTVKGGGSQSQDITDQNILSANTLTSTNINRISVGKEGNNASLTFGENNQTITLTGVNTSLSTQNISDLPTGTNIIIAQKTSDQIKSYLVWTADPVGRNVANAIVAKINKDLKDTNDSTVTSSNVNFRSGANPGTMTETAGDALTYDSATGKITFTDGNANNKWTKLYYGTVSGQTAADIAVQNSYEPAIRIRKVDSKNTSTGLEGAKFKFFKIDDTTKKRIYLKDTAGLHNWDGKQDGSDALVLATNAQGYVEISQGGNYLDIISNLAEGIYYIEESKAPDGYNMPERNIVAINVDGNGIVTQVTDTSKIPEAERNKVNTDTSGDDGVNLEWDSPYYTITIKNSSGFALPETGGPGTIIFTILGLLLLFGGGTWLYFRRKRSKSTFHIRL